MIRANTELQHELQLKYDDIILLSHKLLLSRLGLDTPYIMLRDDLRFLQSTAVVIIDSYFRILCKNGKWSVPVHTNQCISLVNLTRV
jgi:hypothetical protein